MPANFALPETAVTMAGKPVAIPGYKENLIARPMSDEEGILTFIITVPNRVKRGLQFLSVYVRNIFEARNEVVVQSIPLSLTSISAVPYQDLWVMSKGFTPKSASSASSDYVFNSQFLNSVEIDGQAVHEPYIDSPIVIGSDGAVFFRLTVPKTTSPGSVELRIIDTDGRIGTANIDVPNSSMSADKTSAYPGETVNFSMTGLIATNSRLGITNKVDMKYIYAVDNAGISVTAVDIGQFVVDESGETTGTFITPKSVRLSSSNTVSISPRHGKPLWFTHNIGGPQIDVKPQSGLPHDFVKISLKGMPPNYRLPPGSILMAGTKMLLDYEGVTPISDDLGGITFTSRVPSGVVAGTQSIDWYPPGVETISKDFEVTEGKLNVSPSPAAPGQEVTIISEGFAKNLSDSNSRSINIQITGTGDSYVSIEGVRLRHDSIDYPIKLNKNGEFKFDLTLPIENSLGKDRLELTTLDTVGRTGRGSVDLKAESISVTPSASRRGRKIQIIGNGFVANSKGATFRQKVLVEYGGIPMGAAYPDSEGSFSYGLVVPVSAKVDTSHKITAALEKYPSVTAHTTHTVPGGEIKVTPKSAQPGSKVKVAGTGFPASRQVTIGIGHLWAAPPPIFYTDHLGEFEQIVTVPLNAGPGTVDLKVYIPYPVVSGKVSLQVEGGKLAPQVQPTQSAQSTPVPASNGPDILTTRLLSRPYLAPDGLEIMLLSLSKIVTGNVTSIRIEYSLNNPTPNLITEGSLKLYYADGGGLPQYGFFNSILPGDGIVKSYTFNVPSPNKPWYVGYPSRFFGDWKEEDLLWEVD
jgi:hypothetical protein